MTTDKRGCRKNKKQNNDEGEMYKYTPSSLGIVKYI